jgi:hypothetical protein
MVQKGGFCIRRNGGFIERMPSVLDAAQRSREHCIRCYNGHKDRKPNHIAAIVPTTNARLESGRRIGDWRKGLIVSATGMIAKPTGTAAIAR